MCVKIWPSNLLIKARLIFLEVISFVPHQAKLPTDTELVPIIITNNLCKSNLSVYLLQLIPALFADPLSNPVCGHRCTVENHFICFQHHHKHHVVTFTGVQQSF